MFVSCGEFSQTALTTSTPAAELCRVSLDGAKFDKKNFVEFMGATYFDSREPVKSNIISTIGADIPLQEGREITAQYPKGLANPDQQAAWNAVAILRLGFASRDSQGAVVYQNGLSRFEVDGKKIVLVLDYPQNKFDIERFKSSPEMRQQIEILRKLGYEVEIRELEDTHPG